MMGKDVSWDALFGLLTFGILAADSCISFCFGRVVLAQECSIALSAVVGLGIVAS